MMEPMIYILVIFDLLKCNGCIWLCDYVLLTFFISISKSFGDKISCEIILFL